MLPEVPRFDLETLEFRAVRELLLARLTTPLGRTAVGALRPLGSVAAIHEAQQRAVELAERLAQGNRAPVSGVVEVRSWTGAFFAGEHVLSAKDLADLKRVLRCAECCRRWLAGGEGPALQALAVEMPDLSDLVDELELMVDDRGEVLSTASAKLADLRREIEAAEAGVRSAVQALLADDRIRRCLQSPDPAWRHGRPVFQVRQESRGRVPGVLHDRSQSGATLFIEPAAVVDAANRLSDARAAEHREIQVLLAHISRGLRRCRDQIEVALHRTALLDLALACARLIREDSFVVAPVVAGGPLRLCQARHPILMACTAPAQLVPLDVVLGDPGRLLVVTGPNTGGKTVALKTIGLLAVMASCGLPVPAEEGTQFPLLDGVFADIGDEQAISQNLSTFSAHVKRIVRCLRESDERSLVLLDELGAGTDPEEGGALGFAALELLESRRVLAVVTTHIGRLKEFAHRHSGAVNGAMAFDGRTLRPLFRLELGIPGSSHALDIAARVGMPPALVARATELLGRRDMRVEDAVQRVQEVRRDAEEHARRAVRLNRDAERAEQEARSRLEELERRAAWVEEEADALVEEELRRARDGVAGPLGELRRAPAPWAEVAAKLDEQLREALVGTRIHRRRMKFVGGLRKGAVVYVPRFRRRCVLKKVDRVRELLTLEVGKMLVEVPFEDVSWLQPLDEG